MGKIGNRCKATSFDINQFTKLYFMELVVETRNKKVENNGLDFSSYFKPNTDIFVKIIQYLSVIDNSNTKKMATFNHLALTSRCNFFMQLQIFTLLIANICALYTRQLEVEGSIRLTSRHTRQNWKS
jgi:hypothetical protein